MCLSAIGLGLAGAGSIAGGLIGGSSQKKAASQAAAAANQASAIQRQNFEDALDMIRPQIDVGDDAREAYAFELGLRQRPTFMPTGYEEGAAPEIVTIPGGAQYGANPDYLDPDQQIRSQGGTYTQQPQQIVTGFDVDRFEVGGDRYTTRAEADARLAELLAERGQALPEGARVYEGFKATPGYQFRMDEGLKAIDRGAAARGGFDSGRTMKAMNRYAQNIAADEYGTFMNRLAGLAGAGQTATGQAFSGQLNSANAQAAALQNAGNARALGTSAFGDSISGIFGDLAGFGGFMAGGGLNGVFTKGGASTGVFG